MLLAELPGNRFARLDGLEGPGQSSLPVAKEEPQPRNKKARPLTRCPSCGFLLDPALPDCRHCGAQLPDDEPTAAIETTASASKKRAATPGRFIPWGLIATLVVYAAVVQIVLSQQYYTSSEYQAAVRLHEVAELLGSDDGRTVPRDDLTRALTESLEAASLMPENAWTHQRAELIAGRMRERAMEVPEDLRRKMEFMGARWREMQDARGFDLPIGSRDLWDVDAVLAAPRTVVKFALIGAVLIALVWGYLYYQEALRRRAAESERIAGIKKDLRQLNMHRRRVKTKG
jgi:hypothetical protein